MNKNTKIYVAGHKGMVGSAIWQALLANGYTNLVGKPSAELNLKNQTQVHEFFTQEQPEVIIDAAARVGGILANNDYPYTFLMDNLLIQNNLIEAALKFNINHFIFLGSSCIYPKLAPQPLKEEYLLTDSLEPTNQWYAVAKITGVKTCEAINRQFGKNFVSLMPTNLYGPNDNYDLQTSHVLPAMMRKFHEAKLNQHAPVTLWGSGQAMREFMYVEDMAEAVVFALQNNLQDHLYNVGTGTDLTIKALAELLQSIVGHQGEIVWDRSKPDGTPRKLLDVSKLAQAGWQAKTPLKAGLSKTYEWFLDHVHEIKEVKIETK